MIVQFHGITFDLAAGWEDITDDVPGAWPPTLAKASGVGALQFSIAKYRSGEKPNAGFDVLRSFMIEFCHNNLIDTNHISEEKFASTMSVGVLYRKADETLSAWYLSNGNDFAFVTYVGLGEESEIMNEELDEVRAVVSSISF
ncbi:MAG: hypothetical protein EOS58_17200 [Mesorhizobium sp.]|uniref:hypothetical protein n=2 Tax=Mesorhizobium TaxID=68287 RepID=UPI000F75CCB6|nr:MULTISPECIES: hypothetical protein [unclassified Mesorhizobium]AZO46678.1 hypothetical protein EJ073_01815 [Mesorhizobium sp. M4B.F.Ca.ET.058.02.1.1]RUX48236.1 hypothetical protein EOA33_16120 [Mesorhizobium sp. M4A.F.Ca.ET.050.02.1.1]RVD41129.1 hypothetical protein EN742_10975 [Mesorhizobium sp. M4A.F.Ca.ET.020.02.1.1]RWC21991.1 MAG: hypothetical protein EOS53_03380 [Mesorhizobium sp.]RWC49724.1 MAG: hypothetical protein EOS54_21855 [Mesorhizobium sp.]